VLNIYLIADATEDDKDFHQWTHELGRKALAEGFWNSEIEEELRDTGQINHIFPSESARESLMDEIDKTRAEAVYSHDNCTEECKKRGI